MRALERLGFPKIRQSGNYVIMRRGTKGCVVPMHSEVKVARWQVSCFKPTYARRIHRGLVAVAPNPGVNRTLRDNAAQRR